MVILDFHIRQKRDLLWTCLLRKPNDTREKWQWNRKLVFKGIYPKKFMEYQGFNPQVNNLK